MAKASNKATGAGQGSSRNGGRRASTTGRKPGGAKASATSGDPPVVIVDAVTVEALTERSEPPTAVAGVGAAAFGNATAEIGALSEALRAARGEVAELLAALRSEAAAAVAEVIELRHQCRQTGEKLVLEIGEQSLALTRVRQAREQAGELARGTEEARADVRALCEECLRATEALDARAEQSRAAFQESLNEVLAGVRQLRQTIETARVEPAEPFEPHDAVSGLVPTSIDLDYSTSSEEKRNRFGVTVELGVVITDVLAGGPAETAGFARGDVIEEANGRSVRTGSDLRDAVEAVPDGEDVTLQMRRGGDRLVRTVRLGNGAAEGKNRFGVTVAPRVVVAEVFAGSPAEVAGLARGDVIEDAHGHPIETGEQFLSIIHAQPEGAEVMLVVTRTGARRELLAHLDHA